MNNKEIEEACLRLAFLCLKIKILFNESVTIHQCSTCNYVIVRFTDAPQDGCTEFLLTP